MTPREVRILALSFLVTSILGAAVVVGYWVARGQAAAAAVRAGLFVAIMAGVHVVGARLYREQHLQMVPVGVAPTGSRLASSSMSPALARAIGIALAQQVPLLVLGALMLDFGVALYAVNHH